MRHERLASGSHLHSILLVLLLAAGCVACTGAARSFSATPSPALGSVSAPPDSTITVQGRPYDEHCQPVAEALVDVPVSTPGEDPVVRAIAGLWFQQAVAVRVKDLRDPCGLWTLAVAPDLSVAALTAIETEVKQGVANFGVTASPVPKDPHNGMG